jgi:hypothetical protein
VLRFQGCLGSVPRAERRVLSLRAGVGIAHTRTRSEVARMTGLRASRVARLEHRGLQRLRGLGRAGRCAAASNAAPSIGTQNVSAAPNDPSSGGGAGREATANPSPQHASSKQPARQIAVDRPLVDLGGAPLDFAPLVIAFIGGALLVLALREMRRT